MALYEVWLTDDSGNRLDLLSPFQSLDYTLVVGGIGWIEIKLKHEPGRMYSTKAYDRQLHLYRGGDGFPMELLEVYFCRSWITHTNSEGKTTVTIGGEGPNSLLNRRIIAYNGGSTEAEISGAADDLMKELVRDNMGSDSNTDYAGSAITTRDLTGKGFSIAANGTKGPTVSKACAWADLLPTLESLQAASRTGGNEVFFGVVADSPTTFEFRTSINQWGADRTLTGSNPLRFGLEWGNLSTPTKEETAVAAKNFVYVGGQGLEDARNIQEVSDTAAIGVSRFGRNEAFEQATNVPAGSTNEDAMLQAVGNARLAELRARTIVHGEIIPTAAAPFGGSGWKLGDKITVSYFGQFDARIRTIHGRVTEEGETVVASVDNT